MAEEIFIYKGKPCVIKKFIHGATKDELNEIDFDLDVEENPWVEIEYIECKLDGEFYPNIVQFCSLNNGDKFLLEQLWKS
ncbi:MAG: hypothetical protein LW821_10370 [Flammeovirgaceae bacterium]|jgi:hypothetical protein|nr:hypothetical protein [Flammeovirgaceae bacterium]